MHATHQPRMHGGLYLDALGNPGRSDGQQIYAQCLVWLPHSEVEIEGAFVSIRRELGLPERFEFHARQVTKEQWKQRMPQRFFASLYQQGLRAEVWCVGVRKHRSGLPLEFEGKRLVNELVSRTLLEMPREHVDGVSLTIDERVHDKKAPKVVREMRTYLNNALNSRGYSIGPVRGRESHECAGIQLADFLATAIVKPWPDCQSELASWDIHVRWW